MDAPGTGGTTARAGGFDMPLAEAAAAIGASANGIRAARERYRDAYLAEQSEWRRLRTDLDEVELHRGDKLPEPDPIQIRELRGRIELLETDLGRHRAELSRLDLALDNLETTWLFIARNDGSLVMDPSNPATAAALKMRIVEAQEQERSRLAQEIHDGPAQSLTNAIFQVQYVERVLQGGDVDLARTELRYLGELLRRELSDVRSYISQLHPPLLDQLGLEGAIRDTVEHIATLSGMAITCELTASAGLLGESEQTVVLRIAQEALQNVRKHSMATHVALTTMVTSEGWTLQVSDDGRGFDLGAVASRGRRNFGLQFMRERAGLIGARFEVRSQPDSGTTILLIIPVSAKESS